MDDTREHAAHTAQDRAPEGNDARKFSLKDGLSIDEAKVSVLIICTLGDFALVAWCMITQGDITDNHLYVFQTLIAAVAGVNIADKLAGFIKRKG